jgi:hypothetical protein
MPPTHWIRKLSLQLHFSDTNRLLAICHLSETSSWQVSVYHDWNLGRIGDQSFDETSGWLLNMFDFQLIRPHTLILNPATGQPI